MNLTSKTPSNVRISIKGNFPIKTSEVLFVFHNLIYSRFIGQWRALNRKTNSSLNEIITILKTGIELIQSKQPRYLNRLFLHLTKCSTFSKYFHC